MADDDGSKLWRVDRRSARWLTVVLVVGSTIAALAITGSMWSESNDSRNGDPALIAEGSVVYGDHCQICHGITGQGGTGPDLAEDLVERYPDADDQRQVVLDGPRSMPSFGSRLTEHQIDAVIEFTRFGL